MYLWIVMKFYGPGLNNSAPVAQLAEANALEAFQ